MLASADAKSIRAMPTNCSSAEYEKIATRLSLLLLDFIRIILDDILNISFIHN
nr:hypothetical protein [Clostridium septicum]